MTLVLLRCEEIANEMLHLRSNCMKRRVGAVLVSNKRVISTGKRAFIFVCAIQLTVSRSRLQWHTQGNAQL